MSDPRLNPILVVPRSCNIDAETWINLPGEIIYYEPGPYPTEAESCSYCGRRVVSLSGERDRTCAGCGAAT